jgi:hypothetical protein
MNYRKIPFANLGAYAPEYPNSSFLSGSTPVTNVILRSDPTKAPGLPGFIAWLAEAHPAAYNYAFSLVPSNVRIAMNRLKTGGSQLTGTNAAAAYAAIANRSTSKGQMVNPAPYISGLGDDTTAPLIDMSFDTGSVSMPQTVAIADTGESTGVPGLTSAGTSQLVNSLAQAGAAIVQGVDQQRIFNVQLQRAQNGQPPLNTAAYFSATGAALANATPLLWVGGGLLAVYLLMGRKKAA